jgi:ubiquinone biosynthesis protein
MRTIVAVFAKNGFQNVAEKIKVGRFFLERITQTDVDQYSAPERLRMCFEELGPTFVKLGQLLATRPDLIPQEFVDELKKLHDQASTIGFDQIEKVIEHQFSIPLKQVFRDIDPSPLAAASIAQVHRAKLLDGTDVVVKVQRPGIVEVIKNDIGILYFIADLLQKYVPEARPFNPVGIVDEFFKTLELETDFVIEANNIRRFTENFKNDLSVKIPKVYFEYSSKKVLVLEELKGIPLSQPASVQQEGVDPIETMRVGVRTYFKMVFRDGLFHGDLHAGNLFILPNNQIGLVDFGIVGRLNRRTQTAIANMFVCLYSEDYERLAYEYVEIAPYNEEIDVDEFAIDLQNLLAPHFGLSMKNVDLGLLLMGTTQVAAKHRLILPTELMMFFKSIVTVEGMGRMLAKDFDLLPHALEFSKELVQDRYQPAQIKADLTLLSQDIGSLLYNLPRQIKQLIRKVNHPDFAAKISVQEIDELKRSIETGSNIVFLGLIIGALILAGSVTLFLDHGPYIASMPIVSGLQFLLATLFGMLAFYNYIKK